MFPIEVKLGLTTTLSVRVLVPPPPSGAQLVSELVPCTVRWRATGVRRLVFAFAALEQALTLSQLAPSLQENNTALCHLSNTSWGSRMPHHGSSPDGVSEGNCGDPLASDQGSTAHASLPLKTSAELELLLQVGRDTLPPLS